MVRKRGVLLLVILLTGILFPVGETAACHVAGGSVTYQWIAADTYRIKAVFLRACNQCPGGVDETLLITARNNCGHESTVTASLLPGSGGELPRECEDEATFCSIPPGTRHGLLKGEYHAIFTIPTSTAATCQDWFFSYSISTRNACVTLNGGNFFVDAYLNNLVQPNSSPTFRTLQVPAFCILEPVNLLFDAIDPEGDSLSFSLTNALTNAGTPAIYNTPYTSQMPVDVQGGVININQQTGNVSFVSTQAQNGVFVLKADKYRNGVLLGYSKYDVQVALTIGNLCDNITPTYRDDTIAINCGVLGITVPLNTSIRCNTVTNSGSEFRMYASDGNIVPIVASEPDTCNTNNRSHAISLTLHQPLLDNGYYYLVSRSGLDGNTFGNKCDKYMKAFDTLVIVMNSCPHYRIPLELTNVSVDSVNQNATYVQWADPYSLNQNWFSNFLLWRRDNVQNNPYERILHSVSDPTARSFSDVYPETLPADSRIFYKVNLLLINQLQNPLSDELGTMWLVNNPPDRSEDLTLTLYWSPFTGWPAPLYFLQYKINQDNQSAWLFPEAGASTTDTAKTFIKPLKAGSYYARILTVSPGGLYRSYSNWIPFEVPVREIKTFNVVTPNGDGVNDRFFVENLEFYPGSKLQVFNRWGQQVYSHTAYNNDWEPNELENGSYYFNLVLPEGKQLTGMFAVVR